MIRRDQPHLGTCPPGGVKRPRGPNRSGAARPEAGGATAERQRSAQEEIEEEEHSRILEDAAQGANLGYPCPTGSTTGLPRTELASGESFRRRGLSSWCSARLEIVGAFPVLAEIETE